ncbi:HTH domain-containing protein [Streptosporangiaceae bacterium NEAU-GS5]|nr:HTH domain-containing protein [Streptosporangiaceae bacterium NEAU-GS5]
MATLTSRDYQRLLDLTSAILNSDQTHLPWPLLPRELCQAIPWANISLLWSRSWGKAPPDDFPMPYRQLMDGAHDSFTDHCLDQHPLMRYLQTGGDRTPRILTTLGSPDGWDDEHAYHVARNWLGDGPHLAIPLPAPRGEAHFILLQRDGDRFTPRELQLATQLEPLLAGVVNQQRHLLRWRIALPAASEAPALALEYRLTPRELAVLNLLAEACTGEMIARRLGISPRTVNKHLERLYRKLGTRDRLATILRAQETGLLPPRLSAHHERFSAHHER